MKTFKKAVGVLRAVAVHEGVTARELAELVGLPRSTIHRMLAGLVQLRMVERDTNGGYLLGSLIGELAETLSGHRRLVQISHPIVVALRDACGETVGVHVLESQQRVLLHQAETTQEHRWVYMTPGQYMPLHAGASSKMLLALLGDRAEELLRTIEMRVFTRNTPRDPERLMRELRRIRRQGYAISVEEVKVGIASIAMAIDGGDATILSVMSVTGPTARMTLPVLRRIRPLLARAVIAAGSQLRQLTGTRGGRPRAALAPICRPLRETPLHMSSRP